jgi:exosortase H (IPTLxxWG-CTERM-specific)
MSTRRSILRFLALVGGLTILFYAAATTHWFRTGVFPRYLESNASVASALLRMMGEDARATNQNIISSRYALQIRRGCDAVEPMGLFVAAAIAFPASWRSRLSAVAFGIGALFVLNQVRIISLYYTGVHFPQAFNAMHVDVWQPLFVLCAMLLWLIWASRAAQPAPVTPHAAA